MTLLAGIRQRSTFWQATGVGCVAGGLLSKGALRVALTVFGIALVILARFALRFAPNQAARQVSQPSTAAKLAVPSSPPKVLAPSPNVLAIVQAAAPLSSSPAPGSVKEQRQASSVAPASAAASPVRPQARSFRWTWRTVFITTEKEERGQPIQIKVRSGSTVRLLKRRIEMAMGYPVDSQELALRGRPLSDSEKLNDCGALNPMNKGSLRLTRRR